MPGTRSRRWIVVTEGRVEEVELVVVDGIDGLGGVLWPQGGRRSSGRWRPAHSALAEPWGIPEVEMAQDPFDDIVLLRRADGGDNLHGLLAGGTEAGVLEPDLGDELCPASAPTANEVRVILLGRGRWRQG